MTHRPLSSSILNVGSGFLFGLGIGFLTALIGVNVGATAAFYISRKLVYNRVKKRVERFKYFRVCKLSDFLDEAAISLARSSTHRWRAMLIS